ncbi:MAG: GNAT family N-acetyltransferase, partial [Candidatus Bipolaricaulota bacterium]|nr:GNAT family N-acetyltransferase [Candidatus Bipolaricaulota bacterium]
DIKQANGEMAAWIDGKLYIHYKALRWRTAEKVRIKRAYFGLYVHHAKKDNTVWYDDVTRATYCEPVGTMPEHQRRGLAKAVIAEGMRRSKEMGALFATVGSGGQSNPPADPLYARMFQKGGVSVTGWLKYLDGKP